MAIRLRDKARTLPATLKFPLAGTFRRCMIRLFDLILASLLLLPFALTVSKWGISNTAAAVTQFCISVVIILLYFLVIPWALKGNTIGKKLFRIQLVAQGHRVKFWQLCARETFIIFIPYMTQLVVNLVLYIKFGLSLNHALTSSGSHALLLVFRLVALLIVLWYVVLICLIAVDPRHQFYVDYKFKMYVTLIKPLVDKPKHAEPPVMSRADVHTHLEHDQPGVISEGALKDISDEA